MNDLLWEIANDKRNAVCQALERQPLVEAMEARSHSGAGWWAMAALMPILLVILHALAG